jgi:hypothetical protein
MRLAKLDPIIAQPVVDNADVDLYLHEVEEENHNVHSVAAESDGEREPDSGGGLAHLMEFISRRRQNASRSKNTVALERYETQKLACLSDAETEMAEITKFNKFA